MANSFIVGDTKNQIIKDFIRDDAIIQAIEPVDITLANSEELIGKYIFNFAQNPTTINDVKTFITIQTNITNRHYANNRYVDAAIEIWVISHEGHMVVSNVPKVTENRNDYLSRLIDARLNGSRRFGAGKLELTQNVEGAIQKDWLYRRLVFEVIDINDSYCDSQE